MTENVGHTASLWQGRKLLVYGGENEHRSYLSDVIVFDLKTSTWTQPETQGTPPRGRARHAAVIHDEKLWISGGMAGHETTVLDDICYLDLQTWTWSRSWKFVPRYDHTSWVWGGRIWVFGGMGEQMERNSELWWIDFRDSPAFNQNIRGFDPTEPLRRKGGRPAGLGAFHGNGMPTVHAANSSSVQTNPGSISVHRISAFAPASVSMMKFVSSPHLPSQPVGNHFHAYTSGYLLDFVTPSSMMSSATDNALYALDLDTLKWHNLADGKDIFSSSYRWHYCTLNDEGTQAWFLGCPPDQSFGRDDNQEDLLSDVLNLDLTKLGIMGNKLHLESNPGSGLGPTSDTVVSSPLSAIGADLARTFDQPPETGSGTDFVVVGQSEDDTAFSEESENAQDGASDDRIIQSKPIHVHKLILQARWPHFARMYSSQMREFHTKKLVLPEPYSTVRAFLYYLYTDNISGAPLTTTTTTTTTEGAEARHVVHVGHD